MLKKKEGMPKISACGTSRIRSFYPRASTIPVLSLLMVCLGCLALAAVAGCADEEGADIVAHVGSLEITAEDFRAAVEKIGGKEAAVADLDYSERLAVLDALIAARLLILEAEKRGIDQNADIVGQLLPLERKLLKQALYERDVWPLAKVSDSALQVSYAESGSGEELHVAHILVRTGEEAAQILGLLAAGTSFEELVRERSKHIDSVQMGGSMSFLRKTQLLPEIADAVWAGALGELHPEPIRTRMGYHVVKLIERRWRSLAEQSAALTARLQRLEKSRVDALFKDRLRSDYELTWHPRTAVNMARLEDRIPGDGILYSWLGGSLDVATYVKRAQNPRAVSDDTAHTRSLAEGLAFDVVIAIEARKRRYDQLDEVRNKLGQLRLQLLSDALFEAEIGDPTAAEMSDFHRANQDTYIGDRRITIREILVDDQALADSLFDRISAGEEMSELARRYTVRTDLRKTGGLWEEVARSDPRGSKIYRIALDSEGLQKPLKVPGGYSVFEVLEKHPGLRLSLEEVEEQLKEDLATLAMDRFIGDLRKRHAQRIRIHEEALRRVE